MGTNEPGRSDDEGKGSAGDPYAGSPQYPSGPSYSGYREGVHGEPVPDGAWQDPTAQYPGGHPQYPGGYPQYPQHPQDPGGGYRGPTDQYPPAGPPPGYPSGPYGPYPPAPWPVQRATNGMAVASLVLGILWLYWFGSILALIFGYIARQQIRERGEGGDGLAVAGIVLGWIGVGVLVLIGVIAVIAGLSSGVN